MKAKGNPTQEAVRNWVLGLLERAGLTATALEERAGIGRGTLSRFLNRPVKHILSHRTMVKAAAAVGETVPFQATSDGTNVDILKMALADARSVLDPRLDPDYAYSEARTAAQIYDVLMDTLRSGDDLEQARQTVRRTFRRAGHIPR